MKGKVSLFGILMIAALLLHPWLLSAQEPSAGQSRQPASTAQTDTESKQESSAETPRSTAEPPQASGLETKGKETDRGSVVGTPAKPSDAEKKGKEDRRWITRIRPDQKKPMPKKSPPPLTWADEEQKKRCDSLIQPLKEHYSKARYYSIHGDSCATAEHSKTFLTHVDSCQRDCPKDFLKRNGYDDVLIRNVRYLQKSGNERCAGTQQQKKSDTKSTPAPKP
jgi:hypothetical protein